MTSQSFDKKISERHQEISMPGHAELASDDFTNATQPFADRKYIL